MLAIVKKRPFSNDLCSSPEHRIYRFLSDRDSKQGTPSTQTWNQLSFDHYIIAHLI